jgi:hypothetical protein
MAARNGFDCSTTGLLAASALGASGLIYRSQSVRTEKRHLVTAPPRLAKLNSDRPLRVHPRADRTIDGRAAMEFALRRSRIVARKHGVDRAKAGPGPDCLIPKPGERDSG